MRATNPAIPVWIHKLKRLLLQLLRQARANIHHQLCQVHHHHLLQDHGQLHVKSCNPKIRSWTTTLVPEVAGSAMHLLCLCTHHPEWALHHLLLLSPTLVQPWELRVLRHKLAHNKVGSQTMKVRRIGHHLPKLVIKKGDATTLTRVINEWIQKTTISLSTWPQSAATFWAQVVGTARQRHNWWLSLSPHQRVNAHRTTHHRSDNTTPTTHTRGHDESRAAEQCPHRNGSKPLRCRKVLQLSWTCSSPLSRPICHQSRVLEWKA